MFRRADGCAELKGYAGSGRPTAARPPLPTPPPLTYGGAATARPGSPDTRAQARLVEIDLRLQALQQVGRVRALALELGQRGALGLEQLLLHAPGVVLVVAALAATPVEPGGQP